MKKVIDKFDKLLKNQHCSEMLYVLIQPSLIDGVGLFALCAFKPGHIICSSKGYIINTRKRCLVPWESRISYQLSKDHHFVPTSVVNNARVNALAKVNHGCVPNSCVQFDPQNRLLVLKAVREISAGEEIICNYCTTEVKLAHPFFCKCGMNNCHGFIRGAQFKTF